MSTPLPTVPEILERIKALDDLSGYGAKDLVTDAKAVAQYSRDLKTAQIRKIYGTVKKLELEFQVGEFQQDKLILLLPKLAWAANKESKVRNLQEVLSACIDKVRKDKTDGKKDFAQFVSFFEAILAYHKG